MLASFCFWMTVFAALTGCESKPEFQQLRLSGATMGTSYHISVITDLDEVTIDTDQLQRELDQLLVEINQAMSTYIPDSEINRLNDVAVDEWTTVSAPLFEVFALSHEVSQLSSGAFDITVRPLIDLWGFGATESHDNIPPQNQIADKLKLIGYQYLQLDRNKHQIRKKIPLTLDLSAVAKGYGVDKIAEHLLSKGLHNFLVEIGGELRLSGHNASGVDWRIAIERPDSMLSATVFKALQLTDIGIATSGDYRNYFEVNGVRYSHTIDPRNGYPITHNLASVTVLDKSAARADAWATAFSVMGAQKALALANAQKITALFIVKVDDTFEAISSDTFSQSLSVH